MVLYFISNGFKQQFYQQLLQIIIVCMTIQFDTFLLINQSVFPLKCLAHPQNLLMKTISLQPVFLQKQNTNTFHRTTRKNNSISLQSPALDLSHKHTPAHIFYIRFTKDSDRKGKSEQTHLPPMQRENEEELQSIEERVGGNGESISPKIRRKQKLNEIIRPQSTFYIYGRESLENQLKIYQNKNKQSQGCKVKSVNKELQEIKGEQKTVYEKAFIRKEMRSTRHNMPSESIERVSHERGRRRARGRLEDEFTPWATLENDHY